MAENNEQPESKEKGSGSRLVFPQHLAQLIDQDGGYPPSWSINCAKC